MAEVTKLEDLATEKTAKSLEQLERELSMTPDKIYNVKKVSCNETTSRWKNMSSHFSNMRINPKDS